MEIIETRSVAGTLKFGREFAGRLRRGDCVAMIGPLGAGKTALVRGIAEGLGASDTRIVASPTFVLVREYETDPRIHHVDLYRLGDGVDLFDLGMDEMLADGVVLIEWADHAEGMLPKPRWQIEIEIVAPRARRLILRRIE